MKRTGPPKRRPHPSNPFSTLARRTKPMAKKSASKKREEAETNPHRAAYVANAACCEHCYRKADKLDCHEIAAGSSRQRSVYLANCWLALCRRCHQAVQQMPIAAQYTIKCEAVARDINRALGRDEL